MGGGELGVVRGLVLRRDCGPCLSMPGVAPLLADRLASDEGAGSPCAARSSSSHHHHPLACNQSFLCHVFLVCEFASGKLQGRRHVLPEML